LLLNAKPIAMHASLPGKLLMPMTKRLHRSCMALSGNDVKYSDIKRQKGSYWELWYTLINWNGNLIAIIMTIGGVWCSLKMCHFSFEFGPCNVVIIKYMHAERLTKASPEVLITRLPASFCQLCSDQKLRYELEWTRYMCIADMIRYLHMCQPISQLINRKSLKSLL